MVAAVTLRFLDPFGSGKLVLFQVTYDKDWHAYELFPFLILGVLGVSVRIHAYNRTFVIVPLQGVYGAYFSKLNYRWSRHVRNGTWLKSYPVTEVILVSGCRLVAHHSLILTDSEDRSPSLPQSSVS